MMFALGFIVGVVTAVVLLWIYGEALLERLEQMVKDRRG